MFLEENTFGAIEKYSIKDVLRNQLLIVHSLENLNGFKLNVTMFIREPTAFRRNLQRVKPEDMERSGGYYGLDGSFLSSLANKMNFKVSVFQPIDGENFGYVTKKGRITGSLADIVYGRAEFAGNSRFLMDYGTDHIEVYENYTQ
ncbi:hypothetical protein NQ314_012855 [Rhamnusium bicolor]|uniref:Uncharacterized protein n=1 Tax=Rhamnusium bicolor TaxID=1586634 RepID=A0AAV8XA40_9CUCU|nr:hypothetical protein NQ314_012855 [Rhamnusium bicolor]